MDLNFMTIKNLKLITIFLLMLSSIINISFGAGGTVSQDANGNMINPSVLNGTFSGSGLRLTNASNVGTLTYDISQE